MRGPERILSGNHRRVRLSSGGGVTQRSHEVFIAPGIAGEHRPYTDGVISESIPLPDGVRLRSDPLIGAEPPRWKESRIRRRLVALVALSGVFFTGVVVTAVVAFYGP